MNFYDLIDPVQLTAIARTMLADEDQEKNKLNVFSQWFPDELVDNITFNYAKGSTRTFTNAMPMRGWNTAAPIGKRVGTTRQTGSMPPFSLKFPITEFEKIQARIAAAQGGDIALEAATVIFADILSGINALKIRMERLRAEAIVNASYTIRENGVQLDVDFDRNPANEISVGTAWSDSENCTPMNDEEGALEYMSDEENLEPDELVALMNMTTFNRLKLSKQYRDAMPTFRPAASLNKDQVNEVRSAQSLPPVLIVNSTSADHMGVKSKTIPTDRVVYLPNGSRLGNTQWGVPAIADVPEIKLEQDQRPGPIVYNTYDLDPLVVWTVIDAIGLPILQDPDATFVLSTD